MTTQNTEELVKVQNRYGHVFILTQEKAKYHEKKDEVKILGPVETEKKKKEKTEKDV